MISVVIPLYNKEKCISKTVYSVLNQTFTDFEIVIVNDGSTDGSVKIIENIPDNRIRLFSQVNKGVSSARNAGVTFSSYDYIALLDADDFWEPNYLSEMLKFIDEYNEASIWGCTHRMIKGDKVIVFNYGLNHDLRGYIDNYFKFGVANPLFHTSSVIFRKKDFFDVGSFDVSLCLGEDTDLWIRFALLKRVAFMNKLLTFRNANAENTSQDLSFNKTKEQILVYNLNKYREFELSNIDFKVFLDVYRKNIVKDYLSNNRREIKEINSILREVSPKESIWKLLLIVPHNSQKFIFKRYLFYSRVKNKVKKLLNKIFRSN